ncbi:MAG: molybdopterin-dependent oxidoreductase [Chloroflexi bacterium]|nr:molybdopterin-dependent oxidoreductase [Chloroflexota bacterium]
MAQRTAIGQRAAIVEGAAKATGQARFTDDVRLPGELCGKILRSPHPHARLLNVDTSRAERLPGVRATLVGKETPGIRYGARPLPGLEPDQQGLATSHVRYVGDEVAAVAAIDEDTAEEALQLIEVDYEPLTAVFDPFEAIRPEAPQIHDHSPGNISVKHLWNFGDVERGFAESDYIREDRFTTSPVGHCALEPHACMASFEPSGRLALWAATAAPFTCRAQLAMTLQMPESDIRIISPYVGGHFGSKVHMYPHYFCAALLSKKTGRPVKITLTRDEVFGTTLKRHPMTIWLKTGVKRDGTLVATDCRLIADGGAYRSSGAVVLLLAGTFLIVTYRLPNVRYEGYRVYTNKSISGAMRGFGAPQMRFAAETQLDFICRELGLDPVEVRVKNAIHSGDRLANKLVIHSSGMTECIEGVVEASNWEEKRGKMPCGTGIGIACSSYNSGDGMPMRPRSGALVKIDEDGGVTLLTGVTNIGQGSDTAMGQIAAEELSISLADLRVVSGDTDFVPVHSGSYSSRGTLWGGTAVKYAAADARRQLVQVVAARLEVSTGDLEVGGCRVWVKGSPEKGMSFAEAAVASAVNRGMPILGRGVYGGESAVFDPVTGEGNLSPAYSFGAQVAEVDVDRETGKVKLLKMYVAHDAGVAINPLSIEGQLHGSVQMGQGQALTEELVTDGGCILNASLADYHMPTCLDVPDTESMVVETEDPTLPVGAKEAGEGTQISTVPAIVNAINDALGTRIVDLPITPDRILSALAKKADRNWQQETGL